MTRSENLRRVENSVYTELAVVFCLLVSLGFPGSLTNVVGETVGKMMEYAAFLIEIALILFAGADTWQDVELIRLDRKYAALYIYVFFCFGLSMLVTFDRKAQIITCSRLVVTLMFVIWLQERYRLETLLELICMAQGAFVLVTILFILRYPQYAYLSTEDYTHALVGLYETKNACGTQLDFGIAAVILLLREKRRHRQVPLRWWLLLAVQIVLLLMCKATGAIITAIVTLLPIYFFRHVRLPLALVYITVNIVFLFCMLTLMPYFEDILVAMGKDATLTGRIPMWQRIIEIMTNDHTMTGYGYGMFWRDPSALLKIQTGFSMRKDPFMASLTTGAHNVVMETWLNTGLLGIAAFFMSMLFSFRNILALSQVQYEISATIMAFLTFNGLTERCLGGNYDYRTVAVFLAMAIACNAAGSVRRAPAVPGAAKLDAAPVQNEG